MIQWHSQKSELGRGPQPLPLTFPSLFLPSFPFTHPPFSFPPLSLPPLKSRTTKIQLWDIGKHYELPSGVWEIWYNNFNYFPQNQLTMNLVQFKHVPVLSGGLGSCHWNDIT